MYSNHLTPKNDQHLTLLTVTLVKAQSIIRLWEKKEMKKVSATSNKSCSSTTYGMDGQEYGEYIILSQYLLGLKV